jgi:hypothetical protein
MKIFGASIKTFNCNNMQVGIYLLTVIDGDRKEVKKLVIECLIVKKGNMVACFLFFYFPLNVIVFSNPAVPKTL